MTQEVYPYAFHRDAEHLSYELEAIYNLVQVSIDSLCLARTLGLEHTEEVLKMAAEKALNAVPAAKKLEEQLHQEWLADIEVQRKTGAQL